MKQIVYIIAVILSISSCAKDELSGREDIDHSKGIRVYVDAVSHTVVETRADNEGAISDLTVLVFDTGDKLTQAAKATVFNNGEIYVKLEHTTEPRKLVVMANVQEIIKKATKPGDDPLVVGTTLTLITDRLLLHPGMIVDDASTGCNITTMPMLSEIISKSKIDYTTTLGTPDTRLALKHRLTKISAISNVPSLQIEAISLRHAPKNGGKLLFFNNAADATPVIDDADRDNYFGADDAGEGAKFPTANQPLYLFSSDNTPDSETGNNTVEMVVKAKYGSDAQSTYYHIRLDKKADAYATKKTLFDLEPATHYRVVFTKVTDPGYPTLEEAIDNKYSNLEYDIVDDSDMSEILTNGQYMLNAINSDCKIYGDFDPNFEYPIADFITDAPTEAKIEMTPVGDGFTVANNVEDINRDGKTITQLKVKLKSQFTSGSVKVRVGNLTKIFTFSIELDPPFIKVDDVLDARIASGFDNKTIALSKYAYNERVGPAGLTDKLEKTSTVYFHFNKITLGDETRIGEAYYTQKTNIHHTKVLVVQCPWIEEGGVRFSTGNLVIGWHPKDGTMRYKIGGAVEYGVLFPQYSYLAINGNRTYPELFHTYYTHIPLHTKNAIVTPNPYTKWDTFATSILNLTINDNSDPCMSLTTGSEKKWRKPTAAELDILIGNKGGGAGVPKYEMFHTNPNGLLAMNGRLFVVANGRGGTNRGLVETMAEIWSSTFKSSIQSTPAYTVVYNYHKSDMIFSVRCVHSVDDSFFNLGNPGRQAIDMDDVDEERYLSFTSNNPITATLTNNLADKIDLTVPSVTPGTMTTDRITIKRRDVLHTGGTFKGQLILTDGKHSIHTIEVSIGMNSVNVGGRLVANTERPGTYWTGGTQWATGHLVLNNWPAFSGMIISKDPREGSMFFKWGGDWGGSGPDGPYSDGSGRDNSSPGVKYNKWTDIPIPSTYDYRVDPCISAGAITGEVGVWHTTRIWRYPNISEITELQNSPSSVSDGIRSYRNGRLVISGVNFLSIQGVLTPNRGGGGFYISNAVDNFYQVGGNSLHTIDANTGVFIRCVKANTR